MMMIMVVPLQIFTFETITSHHITPHRITRDTRRSPHFRLPSKEPAYIYAIFLIGEMLIIRQNG